MKLGNVGMSSGNLRFISLWMQNANTDLSQLSSGDRIFSAAEDPAGLVISETLRSQIGSLNAEINNLSTDIDKYSAVGSTMDELHGQMTNLRSLAVSASNEAGSSPEAQAAYNQEAQDIVGQVNRTISGSEYNGRNTLDGSEGSLAHLDQIENVDLSSAESASASISKIDGAMDQLSQAQIDLGSTQRNDLESRRAQLANTQQNLIASESEVRDTDFVSAYTDYIANMIKTRVGIALSAHAGLMGANVIRLLEQR